LAGGIGCAFLTIVLLAPIAHAWHCEIRNAYTNELIKQPLQTILLSSASISYLLSIVKRILGYSKSYTVDLFLDRCLLAGFSIGGIGILINGYYNNTLTHRYKNHRNVQTAQIFTDA